MHSTKLVHWVESSREEETHSAQELHGTLPEEVIYTTSSDENTDGSTTYLGNEVSEVENSDENDWHPVSNPAVLHLRHQAREH